jgi:hypothetical protein
MKNYPAVRFVARHGHALAVVVALALLLLGLWIGSSGAGWIWGVASIAAGALAYLMLRTFAELVDVVADTLIPPE